MEASKNPPEPVSEDLFDKDILERDQHLKFTKILQERSCFKKVLSHFLYLYITGKTYNKVKPSAVILDVIGLGRSTSGHLWKENDYGDDPFYQLVDKEAPELKILEAQTVPNIPHVPAKNLDFYTKFEPDASKIFLDYFRREIDNVDSTKESTETERRIIQGFSFPGLSMVRATTKNKKQIELEFLKKKI